MDQVTGPRLDDQLCFAVYAATNALTRAYRPLLGTIGLTYPQYLVLMVLWQDGTRSVQAIGDRLRLGASAITPLLDRLETAGFVVRGRSETDRRVVLVTVTAAGQALQAQVTVAQQNVVCQSGLLPEAMNQLRQDLLALVERLDPTGTAVEAKPG